jgi:rRNA-processing protein FCF1
MGESRPGASVGLIYDSGALMAADRDDRRVWAIHTRALQRGVRPIVPAGCVVEAWHDQHQAKLARLLDGCEIEPLTEERAKRAGLLRSGTSNDVSAVDASVVEVAIRKVAAIATSDRGDIESLLRNTRTKPQIIDV